MTKNLMLLFALTLLLIFASINQCNAQLQPGTVSNIQIQQSCPGSGWLQGMTCYHALMTCSGSGIDQLGFYYGYTLPSGTNLGTVVLLSGWGGTQPSTTQGGELPAAQAYQQNYEVIQVKWDSAWEQTLDTFPPDTFGNIQQAACRPAGLLNFVFTTPLLYQGGGKCAQGMSAGSAAIVYSITWYGIVLNNIELLSGPVFTDLQKGCKVPADPDVTVCSGSPSCREPSGMGSWTATPQFNDGYEAGPRAWINTAACANNNVNNTTIWNAAWYNMSILNPNVTQAQTTYTHTSMNAWLCGSIQGNTEPLNLSSSQGWRFQQVATWAPNQSNINAVENCDGPEGVLGTQAQTYTGPPGGVGTLINRDMIAQCQKQY